jgi:hypothetical protein
MDSWLSGSLSHDLFFFLRWNSGYQEAFHMNFFFFHDGIPAITEPFTQTFILHDEISATMEHFHEFFFHNGISAITKPLHEFFFHNGISAITKPLHEFFFHNGISAITKLFTRWNLGYHEALFMNFSFTIKFRLSRSLSHDAIHKMHDLGEDSFHIYHKEYLHKICLVKNLAS